MPATIKIKNSSTSGAVPTASDLVQGELAVNVADLGLYTENASGTIVKLNAPSIDDKNTGATKHLTISTGGNLGLNVTPSAWGSSFRGLQIGSLSGMSLMGYSGAAEFGNNFYYDTAYRYAASTSASRYTQSSGVHAWYYAASGTAGNAITFTQAMTLDASGNLGVGTTSPRNVSGYKNLVIDGSTSGLFEINTNGTRVFSLYGAGNDINLVNPTATGTMQFYTNNTERVRIDSSGNLLVGTTSTSVTSGVGFKLVYDSSFPYISTVGTATTNSNVAYTLYSTGASAYRFYVGYGGTVYATSTTISAISDIRFKENVRDLNVGLAEVMALKPRLYDWKEGKGADIKNARGFIAQEFEEVFPDLIDEWRDPAPEGEEPYKSVRADLIPVLVKAIQELNAKVDAQAAEIAALKG